MEDMVIVNSIVIFFFLTNGIVYLRYQYNKQKYPLIIF